MIPLFLADQLGKLGEEGGSGVKANENGEATINHRVD